ncbi:MAG: hypothetical protein ACRD1T_12725 [Acidimicrobiia bacterium]
MSDDQRRNILHKVASGELAPDEAAVLLDSLEKEQAPQPPSPPIQEPEDVMAVRVDGSFRHLRIEGDPSVKAAVAQGPHVVRMQGKTMVFEEDPEDEAFVLFGPREPGRSMRINSDIRIGRRRFRLGGQPPELRIRMNPSLALDIDITAGTARVEEVKGPITAKLAAGSAWFEGVHSPFNASIDAGSLHVAGLFDRGESSIRCTAGKVNIDLDKQSDVRIKARATIGKISLPDGGEWSGLGAGKRVMTIGKGEGKLDIEAITGSVIVFMP